jgi:hypothetical protein
MARIDLHNFFKFYDERNPNHIKAVQWMEDNLPLKFLEDQAEWAEIYRGKAAGAPATAPAPAAKGNVCPHCGKPLGK